jgi:hypothetical protein
MNRGTFVMRDGKLVPKNEARAKDYLSITARSDLPAPYVMSDISEYRSMVTGEIISGRKQHRDHLRAHGVVEVGNERIGSGERAPHYDKGEIAREIKDSIEQIKAGYIPPEGPVTDTPFAETDVSDVKDGDYVRSEVAASKLII